MVLARLPMLFFYFKSKRRVIYAISKYFFVKYYSACSYKPFARGQYRKKGRKHVTMSDHRGSGA